MTAGTKVDKEFYLEETALCWLRYLDYDSKSIIEIITEFMNKSV